MSRESALATIASAPVDAPKESNSPGLQAVPTPPIQTEMESTRINHLMKKEVDLQTQREAFKKEREAFTQERSKFEETGRKWQDLEDTKSKDPIAALKKAGFTETDLINFLSAEEDKSTPAEQASKAAAAEIQKFKDEQAKVAEEAQNKRNAEVLDEFKKDISSTIASDKDKFEYCNYHGPAAEDLIYETVAAVLRDSKEVISTTEAAEMVESYYEEQDKAMSSLKKRGAKAPDPIQSPEQEASPELRNPSKTLSSKTTATVASTTITKKEKKHRLAAKLANFGR